MTAAPKITAATASDVLTLQAMAETAIGNHAAAHAAMAELVKRSGKGDFIPISGRRRTPCLSASLWFLCAADTAGGRPESFWRSKVAPLATRIAQALIQDRFPDTRMTDGGLLECSSPQRPAALLADTLWCNSLPVLARALQDLDPSNADHFGRLSARQRRSFMKAYWCDRHGSLCATACVAGHPAAIDPIALLSVILPDAALPRTKQRQMAKDWAENARGKLGLKVMLDHARFGESPLGLIWLAEAYAVTADSGQAASAAEALSWLQPLHEAARAKALPQAFATDHTEAAKADPWASIELLRVEARLQKLSA